MLQPKLPSGNFCHVPLSLSSLPGHVPPLGRLQCLAFSITSWLDTWLIWALPFPRASSHCMKRGVWPGFSICLSPNLQGNVAKFVRNSADVMNYSLAWCTGALREGATPFFALRPYNPPEKPSPIPHACMQTCNQAPTIRQKSSEAQGRNAHTWNPSEELFELCLAMPYKARGGHR